MNEHFLVEQHGEEQTAGFDGLDVYLRAGRMARAVAAIGKMQVVEFRRAGEQAHLHLAAGRLAVGQGSQHTVDAARHHTGEDSVHAAIHGDYRRQHYQERE